MRFPVLIVALSVAATAQATDSGSAGRRFGVDADRSAQEKLAAETEALKAEREALKVEFERLRQKHVELERRSKEIQLRWREMHPCIGDCYLPGERPDGLKQEM